MEDRQILDAASRIMSRRRQSADSLWQARIDECYALRPELAEIDAAMRDCGMQTAKNIMRGGSSAESEKKMEQLYQRKIQLLRSIKKPADYLEIAYQCGKCADTGLLADRRCDCMSSLISQLYAERLNAGSALKLSSFEGFSLDFYSREIDPNYGFAPYEVMENVLAYMTEYAKNFTNSAPSLLLWGNPGLGKTHLALAAAADIINKGFSVVYIPANTLFAELDRERFGRRWDDDGASSLDMCLAADLLVMDDLGTEFITPYTQSQLYNIINSRLLTKTPTIVSTNLEPGELREKYPPRLVSRLTGSYEDLLFIGKDVRVIKKHSK